MTICSKSPTKCRGFAYILVSALCLIAGYAAGHATPVFRRADWPHWRDVPEHPCRSVRQAVLIRDARHVGQQDGEPVALTLDAKGCFVLTGTWLDPYTGDVLTNPATIQVDHVISLSEAHRRGGWAWSRDKKGDYANDRTYRFHLIPVGSSVNQSKGDRDAAAWTPARREFHCQFGQARAVIAILWKLTVSEPERDAIRSLVATC